MGTVGNWIGELGGAVGSLFQAEGNTAEANSYTSAAQLDEQNAELTNASTQIQGYQEARTVAMSEGTTAADVAGAGFTTSGSALDILKSSAQQGALATSLVNIQGAVNENAYAAEAGQNIAKAKAANEANTAGIISAIGSIGGALVSGGPQLASYGQTVYQGVESIFGGSDIQAGTALAQTTSPADALALLSGDGVSTTGSGVSFGAGSTEVGSGLGSDFGLTTASTTDTAITDTTLLDTSQIPIGTTTAAADAGITSTIGSLAAETGGAAVGAGLGFELGSQIGQGTGQEIAEAVGTVGGAYLGYLAAAAAVALSVICTALYSQKHISLKAWLSAQQYGAKTDPSTFAGYLYWAKPIADRIHRDKQFAKWVAPFFIPMIEEMGVIMKRPGAKRTLYGFISHRALFGLSRIIGYLIRGEYVNSRA